MYSLLTIFLKKGCFRNYNALSKKCGFLRFLRCFRIARINELIVTLKPKSDS